MSATLLAASSDDTRLAYVHGGRLVLCDARALVELAATEAPEGARQLAFIGPPSRLLVATEDELFTLELATMTVLGRRAVASGARVAAVVENRAVLWLPAGPALALARFLDDAIDIHALDNSAPPQDVVPLEQQQALVVTAQRNEVVDLISRRVMARLHMALPPPPRVMGTSGGLRFLWAAALGSRELTIVRLSDGRASGVEVPGPIRAVLTAPTSSWLVVQTDDGLVRVHVVTLAVHRVEAELERGACVGGAADAGLYWIDSTWRLRRTSLVGDAVVATAGSPLRLSFGGMDGARPTPAPPTGITPPGTVAVPAPLSPSAMPGRAEAAASASESESAAPPSLAQLEPSGPVVRAPTVDAPPLFAEPAPVRAGTWAGSLVAVEPLVAAAPLAPLAPLTAGAPLTAPAPLAATAPLAPAAPEPAPTARPTSRLDERVRRAGLRAARSNVDGDAPPAPAPAASQRAAPVVAPASPAAPPSATSGLASSPSSSASSPSSSASSPSSSASSPSSSASSPSSSASSPSASASSPSASASSPSASSPAASSSTASAGQADVTADAPPAPAAPLWTPPAPAPAALPALPDERTVDATAHGPAVAGLTADARPVRSWRMQCAAWARHLLAGRDQLEPSFAGTPLGLLSKRAHLDADGARALALLYGAWLLGRPAQPLARLARAVTWDELAGRGSLPEAGLHTVRSGRAAIRPTVARFLDGARARRMTVHGLRPRTNLAAGKQLVRCTTGVPLLTAAQAVADHLGAAAIIDERGARGRRQLAIAIDEAWLRAVPAVVIPGADLDASAVAAARLRADHTLVVLWPDSIVPEPLEHLTLLDL